MAKDKFIIEYGLEGRQKYAVNGSNTVEDLQWYLAKDPHPKHRLVSVLFLDGNFTLIWEVRE